MKALTINDLIKECIKQINKGNGNKIIIISDDEEGNGYHGLYYSFMDINELLKNDSWVELPINKEEYKDYIILG